MNKRGIGKKNYLFILCPCYRAIGCDFENAFSFHRSSVGMLSLKKDKKEEEEKDGGNPYTHLEKTSVLQEARFGL